MKAGTGSDQRQWSRTPTRFSIMAARPSRWKTTRVKARVKAHASGADGERDRLLIMGHRLADIDSFSAAVGIYRIAMSMNKKANIVVNEVTSSVRP